MDREDLEFVEYEFNVIWDTIEYICAKEDIDLDDFIENTDSYEMNDVFFMLHVQIDRAFELHDILEESNKH